MYLPPSFHDLILEPEGTVFEEPLICPCCEGTTQIVFGYVRSRVPDTQQKPTVYLAEWAPTHAHYGVTIIVARGELQRDEAANMRAMAFLCPPRPGGGINFALIDTDGTRFATALRPVFGKLLSVSAAQKDVELELFHAIAIKVLSEEPRLKPFLLEHFAQPME
jgi:hypothetical protein